MTPYARWAQHRAEPAAASTGTATSPTSHAGVGPQSGRAESSGKAGTGPSETRLGETDRAGADGEARTEQVGAAEQHRVGHHRRRSPGRTSRSRRDAGAGSESTVAASSKPITRRTATSTAEATSSARKPVTAPRVVARTQPGTRSTQVAQPAGTGGQPERPDAPRRAARRGWPGRGWPTPGRRPRGCRTSDRDHDVHAAQDDSGEHRRAVVLRLAPRWRRPSGRCATRCRRRRRSVRAGRRGTACRRRRRRTRARPARRRRPRAARRWSGRAPRRRPGTSRRRTRPCRSAACRADADSPATAAAPTQGTRTGIRSRRGLLGRDG